MSVYFKAKTFCLFICLVNEDQVLLWREGKYVLGSVQDMSNEETLLMGRMAQLQRNSRKVTNFVLI